MKNILDEQLFEEESEKIYDKYDTSIINEIIVNLNDLIRKIRSISILYLFLSMVNFLALLLIVGSKETSISSMIPYITNGGFFIIIYGICGINLLRNPIVYSSLGCIIFFINFIWERIFGGFFFSHLVIDYGFILLKFAILINLVLGVTCSFRHMKNLESLVRYGVSKNKIQEARKLKKIETLIAQ